MDPGSVLLSRSFSNFSYTVTLDEALSLFPIWQTMIFLFSLFPFFLLREISETGIYQFCEAVILIIVNLKFFSKVGTQFNNLKNMIKIPLYSWKCFSKMSKETNFAQLTKTPL